MSAYLSSRRKLTIKGSHKNNEKRFGEYPLKVKNGKLEKCPNCRKEEILSIESSYPEPHLDCACHKCKFEWTEELTKKRKNTLDIW